MNIQLTFERKPAEKLLRYLSVASVLILLTACTWFEGPDYQRATDTPSKSEWINFENMDVTAEDVIRPDWWAEFDDDYLNGLIEQAIVANYNFKILSSRLKEAGIAVGAEETALLPRVGAQASTSFNYNTGAISDTSGDARFALALDWELDLWGKIQKGIDASKASYKASEALWRGGYLKLASDVATKYFEIRQFDQQIAAKQRSLEQNISITLIYRQQLAEGLVANTEVMKQESEVNGTTKDLLDLQRQRKIAENNLSTLLGIPAGEFIVPETSTVKQLRVPVVPVGLPSELMTRRPDLIAAEYEVLKTHYLLGKSKLELFPTVRMTSSGGLVNNMISGALKSYTFGMGPTIDLPLFDPAKWKNIESSEASQVTAVVTYQDKVMQAFAEVENTLVNINSRKKQQIELQSQVDKLTIIKGSVLENLKEGLVSQLDVLEAERSLISTELNLLSIHQQILTDTVTLYKALGGGWPQEYVNSTSEIIVNEN